ncbi:MAG TPA: NUDIX hydrolase [Actinomycetota bacterium]|nr:NUDIX hydrolase [Actinomycetota bacterium]
MAQGRQERAQGLELRRFTDRDPTVRAAGGVVSRISRNGAVEVLIVHRPRYDDWSFPKGKLEPGETEQQCAIREVREETGLLCEPVAELTGTSYVDRKGRPKTVRYWSMRVVSGRFQPNSEVDDAVWADLDEAGRLLTYRHDLSMVEELMEEEVERAAALLVRHGTAGDRKEWEGDDRLRPLDDKGRKQALALADELLHHPIRHIVSSPFVRCVETVEPLARRLGLPVQEAEELAEGAGSQDVARLVERLEPGLAVLCTHGDVVEAIVGPDAPKRKGGYWILNRASGGVRPSRYVPPPDVA